jgi:hypothetical protein
MLPYGLPRESADALVVLNSGSIWPCIEAVSGGRTRPPGRTALKGLAREELSMHCRIPAAHRVVGGTS